MFLMLMRHTRQGLFFIYFLRYGQFLSLPIACEQALIKDGAKSKQDKRGEEREEVMLQPPCHFTLTQFLLNPSSHTQTL